MLGNRECVRCKRCVDLFTTDKLMRKHGALRVGVNWDCNDYQLNIAKPNDQVETVGFTF